MNKFLQCVWVGLLSFFLSTSTLRSNGALVGGNGQFVINVVINQACLISLKKLKIKALDANQPI
ncbi:hypothetical protein ACJMK2_013656 [Sinanodonta woodiana]|uniref:Uncharacterized protein n=1 Tax=Sinanodonta woodiana TaxID=1069815 RepID=A0ABD3UZ11_SINWO